MPSLTYARAICFPQKNNNKHVLLHFAGKRTTKTITFSFPQIAFPKPVKKNNRHFLLDPYKNLTVVFCAVGRW